MFSKSLLGFLAILFSSFPTASHKEAMVKSAFLNSSKVISSWKGGHCSSSFSFTGKAGKKEELFSVYGADESYKGFFTMKEDSTTDVLYEGDIKASKFSDISFLFSSGEDSIDDVPSNQQEPAKKNQRIKYASSSFGSFLCTPNLIVYETYSQSSSRYLTQCPEYYNTVVTLGCAPTVGAMLVSFYDRYSNYNDLYDGTLPLVHNEGDTAISGLIRTLAGYMKTDPNSGTHYGMAKIGIDSYFADHGCPEAKVTSSESFSDYQDFILASENPVYVHIDGHAILGIGFAAIRGYNNSINNYMITHYDWTKRPGNYYVPASEMGSFFYITK
ncbi:MAG: C39 family peptidase [Bacilli bacterium]